MHELRRIVLVLCLVVGCLLPNPGTASDLQQTFHFSGETLKVVNMIGHVDVVPAEGSGFTVTVEVKGADAKPDMLKFKQTKDDDASLLIEFPLEEHREYVYPELGRDGRTTITYRNEGTGAESFLERILSSVTGKRVTVRGRGQGLEVWADLTIRMPRGGSLKMVDRVGAIVARDVEGDLDLDTSSGSIKATDIHGDLVADTGSGAVDVARIRGEVVIDTGSGSVTAEGVDGSRLDVDTGSGSVTMKRTNAATINVDTGSGSVRVDGATCEKLAADTGSGGVTARNLSAERAVIDTGSGSVELLLDHMGSGRFEVDTGSGSISLDMPRGASARIYAETSNGGVHCKAEGAKIVRKESKEMEILLGNGDAKVSLDAGSGTITVATH